MLLKSGFLSRKNKYIRKISIYLGRAKNTFTAWVLRLSVKKPIKKEDSNEPLFLMMSILGIFSIILWCIMILPCGRR
jgi:hypothetical protein